MKVGDDIAGNGEVVIEDGRRPGGDIFALTISTLVLDEPRAPARACGRVGSFDGPFAVGDGIGGVGGIRGEGVVARGLFKAKRAIRSQVKITLGRGPRRPLVVAHPAVGSGLEGCGVFEVKAGLILEIVRKEGRFDLLTELVSGGGSEIDHSKTSCCRAPLTMIPWSENDEYFMVGVVRLQRGVFSLRSPHIFLVPPASDLERGNLDLREVRLHGARTPELVITRVIEKTLPGRKIAGSRFLSGGGEGSGVQEIGVGVFVQLGEGGLLAGLHAENVVVAVGLTKGSV